MTRIVISSNPENLRQYLSRFERTATVEAEYGDDIVKGSVVTLAHHGIRSGNPAPCLEPNHPRLALDVIGISHLDLDALGGVLALLCEKHDAPTFWALAAEIDVKGPHKLSQIEHLEFDERRLYAFWAYSKANRVMPPRDGSVLDVTNIVEEYRKALNFILMGHPRYIEDGFRFKNEEAELNRSSWRSSTGDVVHREWDGFVNHLYLDPFGNVNKAVVALNTKTKAITISLSDPINGVSAKDIVQSLWGPDAGGHSGIAGSPRGREMGMLDLDVALRATKNAIEAARP